MGATPARFGGQRDVDYIQIDITAVNDASVTLTNPDVPADPDQLTYTILGMANSALLSIDSTNGVLVFTVPSDFDTPNASDANNVHGSPCR